jgi:hypothetical protein
LTRDRLFYGVSASGARRDDLGFASLFDQSHESAASQFLVVGDDDGQHFKRSW